MQNPATKAMTAAAEAGTGNRDWSAKKRMDEIQRCIDIIGWSWAKLAERVGMKYGEVLQVKKCKRDLADSDIVWLQDLATAFAAIPRPVVIARSEATEEQAMAHIPATLAPIERPLGLAPLRQEGRPGLTLAGQAAGLTDGGVSVMRDAAIVAIIDQYLAVDAIPDYSDEERGAAKGALAAVLAALGWLDDGKRLLAARQAAAARTMPQPLAFPPSAQWQQPEQAGAIGRVPLG